MEIDDYPLLNEPSLMLAALKSTSSGSANVDKCLQRLEMGFTQAGIEPLVDWEPVRWRVTTLFRYLEIGDLIAENEDGQFVITERGYDTLRDRPAGVDSSVLVKFSEFRAFISSREKRSPRGGDLVASAEPTNEYDEGYLARLESCSLIDNPYDLDTIAHLEWENGWCEASDEA